MIDHRFRLAVAATVLLAVFACARRDAVKPASAGGYYDTYVGRFPVAAFERLERAELERFLELTPGAFEALERSGFELDEMDGSSLSDLAGLVEQLGDVDEVRVELRDSGSSWAEYRETLLKVMTTTAALVEQLFGDMVVELFGSRDAPGALEGDDRKNTGESSTDPDDGLSLLELVPAENVELLLEYEEELEALEDLFE